jgi:hypothetical protein
MDTPLYHEKQRFGLLIIIGIGVAFVVGILATQIAQQKADLFPVLLFAAIAFVVLWGFSSMTITVTMSDLVFGFPLYRKRIPLSKVEVGAIERITFFYGIGIHYVRGWWVFNAKLGRGLRVNIGKTRYLIGCEEPERLQATLLERTGRKSKA